MEIMDLSQYNATEWTALYEKHSTEAASNPCVTEFIEAIDHDVETKLYYEVLESTEQFLFNDISEDYWQGKEPHQKLEVLMYVARFVKNHCKHDKMANLAILMSRELVETEAIGLLRYFREYCSEDARAELFLLIEETNQQIKNNQLTAVIEVFNLCSVKMDRFQTDPAFQAAGAGLTAAISAKFYYAAFKFHIIQNAFVKAYEEVRLFVQYSDLNELTPETRVEVSNAMMLSCLAAENVFAFGEVLEQPIMMWLGKNEDASIANYAEALALRRILEAYDRADMKGFEEAMTVMVQSTFCSNDVIKASSDVLTQKLHLMIVLDICFSKPRGDRVITFKEISDATLLSDDIQIQHLLIKAIGKGLIVGSIDGVEKTITITKTQPQAINAERAAKMSTKYASLIERADNMIDFMKDLGGTTLLNAENL